MKEKQQAAVTKKTEKACEQIQKRMREKLCRGRERRSKRGREKRAEHITTTEQSILWYMVKIVIFNLGEGGGLPTKARAPQQGKRREFCGGKEE